MHQATRKNTERCNGRFQPKQKFKAIPAKQESDYVISAHLVSSKCSEDFFYI